ncbi:MAG: Hsp33 family molecular chaperone HslO [Defluviitaleaceae bacterium]|nr:Hsp33 family molecular chaperone HslO [Defluviitaleaceae bacterium]
MNSDYLVKSLAFNGEIRIYAARTTVLVNEAAQRFAAYPTGAAALGRTLTATVMMGSMLKGHETVTVRINGGGPIGLIVADANAKGEVRGYASNPRVHFQYDSGKLNVGMAVGTAGDLYVTKDVGLKDYFTGQVPLQTGEIGDDFTYYFTQSEQIPSAVGLGVLVNPENEVIAAGGFIIQVMPNASEVAISTLEKSLAIIRPVSDMIAAGMTPEAMIAELVGVDHFNVLETLPLAFSCNCHKEKFTPGLKSLGNEELDAMMKEDNGAEVVCHFCMEKYHFTADELDMLKHHD